MSILGIKAEVSMTPELQLFETLTLQDEVIWEKFMELYQEYKKYGRMTYTELLNKLEIDQHDK